MTSSMPIRLLLCGCFFLVAPVRAQFKFDKPVLVNKDNGLPVNDPISVKKGVDGFVWIATTDGLCRFDGLQVKIFREGNDLRYSLLDNEVHDVLPLKDEVWAGTDQGISVLNTKDYSFRHYQLTENGKSNVLQRGFEQGVHVLYKDRSGGIWVGTSGKGVCLYNKASDNFRFFSVPKDKFPPLVPSLASDNHILSIEQSKTNDSIIWAGTTGGLIEINKYSGQVALFTYPQKSKDYQVALNAFRRLYHHDDGLLYVGSWGASVNIFDPVTKSFTPLKVKSEDGKKILNSVIGDIIRKSDHEIWISAGAGLAVYDSHLKDITWCKFNNDKDYEFYAVDFIDEANRAWNVSPNGLSYFDPAMQQFSRYSYKHLTSNWTFAYYLVSDKSGDNITVCARFADGLFHFNRAEKKWTKVPYPASNAFKTERDVVRGFVQLPSGDYIISSDRGIFSYSEKKKQILPLNNQLPVAAPTRRGEILLDRAGDLWVADDVVGLIKWRPGSKNYRCYQKELLWNDTVGNAYHRLSNLFEDSHGNIWFHRENGLGVCLKAKDSILNFIYEENKINSFPGGIAFAEDKKGRVWISGGNGWLGYALSNAPAKGLVYKTNIRSNGIYGDLPKLAADANGNVWGYTARELVKINADDASFSTYSFQYGIDEAEINHYSFLPGGEMIFGGRNGIVIANPSDLKRNREVPVPYIDEVRVMNKSQELISGASPLDLSYKQNFFSIGFSAKAFTLPRDVKFRYRLLGFDDWNEVKGLRFANYTNVPGGDYTFQLQVANNEGIWNPKLLELPIHIATAFWLTWWFRAAMILAVAIAVYWLYRYRVSQLEKKEKLRSDYEKKMANVEMSALLAQMNPHFLFNSLNSIDSYIIRNESKKASEYLNNFARLVRLILQNSRSNYISLKEELEALELYLQMESLRFKNKFSYAISVDDNLDPNGNLIPPMLIQPFVENAIWHGLMHKTNGEEGKVELSLYKNENNLLCVIQDNGIGRKKSAELKKHKQNTTKRSMGMQITEDRIEIINKLYNINASVHIYDLENSNGESKGTRVELTIPV